MNKNISGYVKTSLGYLEVLGIYIYDMNTYGGRDDIGAYIDSAREKYDFNMFFFLSEDSEYMTVDGKRGYINLDDAFLDLMIEGKSVLMNGMIMGREELLFAVKTEKGSYKGFDYSALVFSYRNEDISNYLNTMAYGSESNSYIVYPDGVVGLVLEDNTFTIRNMNTFLKDKCNDAKKIEEICKDIRELTAATGEIRIEDTEYFIHYEPISGMNAMLLSLTPVSVVNLTLNNVQTATLYFTSFFLLGVAGGVIALLYKVMHKRITTQGKMLVRRDQMYSLMTRDMEDIFTMLDYETKKLLYISSNVFDLLGISATEIMEDPFRVICNQSGESWLTSCRNQILAPGETYRNEGILINQKTGEENVYALRMYRPDGDDADMLLVVLSNRREEQEHRKALEDALKAAHDANRAKSVFLSNMSHDIRTPMNAILGFTALALKNIDDTDKVRNYLMKSMASGNHLLSLINDVLEKSRIESGKVSLEESAVNLSVIFHEITNIVIEQIRGKNLDFQMEIINVKDEDILCDKTRLNQILLNLLSNAIKFTPPGGKVSVRVSQLEEAPEGKAAYKFCIKDNGIGMNQEFVAKIFEPFEREHTSTVSRIQGTGLGMSITKDIVDMMGGTIEVYSEINKGSEFIISLMFRLQQKEKKCETIEELNGMRALIADGSLDTCDSVAKMLRRMGMRTEWMLSGEDAIRCSKQAIERKEKFRVYIISRSLPDMDGIEVVRQICEISGESMAIIILSAYDYSEIEPDAYAAGVTGFCAKPIFASGLREALQHSLGKQEEKEGNRLSEKKSELFCGKRILLAEDNEMNLEIAKEVLEGYGFLVETAENGMEAVRKLKGESPGYFDLILMDIQMPVMDGYEATREIRSLAIPELSKITILAMTANAFEEDKKEALKNGMNGFLPKPIDIPQLIGEMKRIFGNK